MGDILYYFQSIHHAGTSDGRRRTRIAANASIVMSFASFASARATMSAQRSAGILPRDNQLLTADGQIPSPFATALVPPRRTTISFGDKTMPATIFTTGECVKRHDMPMESVFVNRHPVGMEDRPYQDIGDRLKQLRLAITSEDNQKKFCEDHEFAPNKWNQFERGRREITLDYAKTLVRLYRVTLDWIYLGDRSGLPGTILSKIAA